MPNSFIELVTESNKVNEMGVKNIERLTGSELGPIRNFTLALKNLLTAFKQLKGTDIVMEKHPTERKYYPRFPENIVALMRELYGLNQSKAETTIGRWKDLDPSDWSNTIKFKTDSPESYQRSHFPDGGIPASLRGIGLGGKLYRALVQKVGYISSNTSGTAEKDNAWASLLSYKGSPDGTPSPEDVHGIIGPSNWMAIDRSLSAQNKIDAATRFISNAIRFANTEPTEFDIDDDLRDILPDDFVSQFERSYLQSLVRSGRITQARMTEILNSREEAERREQERQERAAREERERLAAQERQLRKRLIARLAQYGADPDADWDVGDYIVVKQYLYDASYTSLPIRKVMGYRGGEYTAVYIRQASRIERNEMSIDQADDTRTTRDKTKWVKVNINEIPDLNAVNLSADEKRYLESQLNPETAARLQADREEKDRMHREREQEQNRTRAQEVQTFGWVPDSGNAIKDALLRRQNSAELASLKEFRDRRFVESMTFIVLGPRQRQAMRNSWAIPVFIPWIRAGRNSVRPARELNDLANAGFHLTNAVTGEGIEGPFAGLGLFAYPLAEVTIDDKLNARAQEHFYIAGHQNVYGVIAKSEHGAVNTTNQRFIYLKVYGFAGRSVSVRLDLLKKLGAPIEI